MSTAPTNLTLAMGTGNAYSVSGGVAPYTAQSANPALVTAGTSGVGGSTLRIDALSGTAGGVSNVIVTDSKGTKLTIVVTVPAMALFTTAPSSVTMPMAIGGQLTFAIAGGSPNYTVTSSNPSAVSVTQSGSAYTLTTVAKGSATIVINDSKGTTVSVSATVPTETLFLNTPASGVTIGIGAPGQTYKVSGGVSPYTVVSGDTSVVTATSPAADGSFTLQGVAAGSAIVTVRDAKGTSDFVSVTVPSPTALYTNAESISTLSIGTTNVITVAGGVPFAGAAPYVMNNSNPEVVRATLSGTTLTVVGLAQGSATVAISDFKGAITTLFFSVPSPSSVYTDAPRFVTIANSTGNTYTIYGGTPLSGVNKYSLNNSDTAVVNASISGSTLTIAALSSGSATLTISDSVGATTTIDVTVPAADALQSSAPSFITMPMGTGNVYAITSGTAPYSALSSDMTLVTTSVTANTNLLNISALPNTLGGTANVIVSDAKGKQLTIEVTVPAVALLTTAPATLAIAAGTPVKNFAILGGSGTYFVTNTHPAIASGIITGASLAITGSIPGTGSLIISDSKGATVTIAVVVNAPGKLYLSAPSCSNTGGSTDGTPVCPTTVYIQPGSSNTFDIIGGIPPYAANSDHLSVGRGTIVGAALNQLMVESFASTALPATAQISVTDAAGSQINITLDPRMPVLRTTAPANVTIAIGSTGIYKISGGTPTYAVVSSNEAVASVATDVAGTTMTITGKAAGVATIAVSDSHGNVVTILVTVPAPDVVFTDGPPDLTLVIDGVSSLYTIAGGQSFAGGVYHIFSSNTAIAITSAASGTSFTIKGVASGSTTMVITDALGASARINVTVAAPGALITTAPANLTLAMNSSSPIFTITGGTALATIPNYTAVSSNPALVTATASTAAGVTSLVIDALPNTAGGTANVLITDAKGTTVTIAVTVPAPAVLFTTAPALLTMPHPNLVAPASSRTFAIVGGSPTYTVTSSNAAVVSVTHVAGAATYTLNSVASGTATIEIKDAKGTIVNVAATVPSAPALFVDAPANVTLAATATYPVTVSGGVGPYTAISSNAAVVSLNVASAVDGKFVLTGVSAGTASVAFKDTTGTTITVSFTVPAPKVLFTDTPANLTLAIGSTYIPNIAGGTAPYSVNNSNPAVVTTPTGSLGVGVTNFSIVAKSMGTATVAIGDANGNVVTIAVTVPSPGVVFTDGPTNLTLPYGLGSSTFSIFGGMPFAAVAPSTVKTYHIASSNRAIATVSTADGTSFDITGVSTGTTTVVITDSLGVSATINVTVTAPGALLTTAPATLILTSGSGAKDYTVSGGVALPVPNLYTATSSNSGLVTASVSGSTLTITALPNTAGGTANVDVSDAKNTQVTIAVTVPAPSDLFTTAPATLTMPIPTAVIKALTFAIAGGVRDYTVTSSNSAVVSVTQAAGSASYTLTSVASGTATIQIKDANGTIVKVDATVPSAPAFFTDAPANVTLAATSTYPVTASGGVGPYTAVSSNAAVVSLNLATAVDGKFVISGVSAGTTDITLKDALGTSITMSVTVPAPQALFTDTSANLTLATGVTHFTTIFGGTAPYLVNSNNSAVVTTPTGSLGVGINKFSIVAKSVGTAQVAISDAKGAVITIDVTVNQGMFTDAPANLTLVTGTGNTFMVYGGTPFAGPPPTYSVNSSNSSVASASMVGPTLTISGVSPGSATLVISDSVGAGVSVNVTVAAHGALMTTAPSILVLAGGSGPNNYAVSGGGQLTGVDKYAAASSDPGLVTASVSGSSLTITALAGTAGGTANVVVSDAKNTQVTIAVTVPAPSALFTTAPATLTMPSPTAVINALTFAIAGGVPDYTVTSPNSAVISVTHVAGSASYTLTSVASGTAIIEIRDAKGTIVNVTVTVPSAPALFTDAPTNVTVAATSTYPVTVSGGVGPYTAVSSDTAVVSLDKVTAIDGKFILTGVNVGTTSVAFKDATGTTITMSVTVPKGLFTDTSANLTLATGVTHFTTIYGGTAPYSVNNSNSAVVTTTPTGSLGAGVVKFSIIAKTVGVATVAISDANGNVVTIAVTVTNGIVTDAPANLTLVSGTGNTFAVFGGTPFAGNPPTYSVNSSDPTVASAVFTGSSLSISALSVGTTTLTISDSVGATTSIKVTVPAIGALLSTAPTNLIQANGTSNTFAMVNGVAPYTVASSNPSLVTAVMTAPVAPATVTTLTINALPNTNGGTANVVVTDAKGAQMTVAVTVPPPSAFFTTAPATLAIAMGSPVTFALIGGTEPYLPAVNTNVAVATGMVNAGVKTLTITGIATGTTTVSVSDSAGAKVTIQVTVVAPGVMTIVGPTTVTIAAGTSDTYDIKAGVPLYIATSSNLAVAKPTIVVSATLQPQVKIEGVATGVASVVVTDQAGSTVTIAVTVPAPSVLFTTAPTSGVYLANAEAVSYDIYGSTLAYTVRSSNTKVVIAAINATVPNKLDLQGVAGGGGTASVFVSDTAGNTVTINVTVGSANAFFVTAPNALTMGSNSWSWYTVSGGAKPYNAGSSDDRVATGSIDPVTSLLTIHALSTGTATLNVSDALGATYSITVVVDNATGAASPAAIEILASSNTLSSAPASSVSFIVTVKDQANTAVPNRTVVFSADSGTVSGANPSPVTNSSGTISIVTLSPGTDATNRNIILTATTSGVSKTITIPVVGTKVSISGAGAALVGSAAQNFTVKAVDSSGKPVVGAVLAIKSSLLNGINPQTVTTDSSGAGTVAFTALNVGDDTLTVTGLGTIGTTATTVSNADFSFTTLPATASLWPVSTANSVKVRYLVAGVPQSGFTVTFGSTRGILSATTAVTDVLGEATVNVSSTTAGPVTVSAQLGTARTSLTGAFIATVPASVVLQANPAAVLPNTSGSANQSELSAIVRDAVGNPVQGVVVNFTAVTDGSNGTITPGSVTTDASGLAKAQFIPGSLSTSANGVRIDASLQANPSITKSAFLTVNGEALFISIGRSNLLINFNTTTYKKDFTVYVTDANGAPAANRSVTLSVDPVSYDKGYMAWSIIDEQWVKVSTIAPSLCINEDNNRNGILDSLEDINSDGVLQPGIPAVITSSVTTDAFGFAPFTLSYGKNYALWVQTAITAKSLVGGTESRLTQNYDLEMTAEDAKNKGSPANIYSPYGGTDPTIFNACTNAY